MEKFGRYVLLECIATGGMAEVHRALALGPAGFARTVAVKRILPHLCSDIAMTQMFVEEARVAATFSHPNVVRVLDLGEENGQLYLAMDFIAGQTLSALMARAGACRRQLPPALCFHLVEQVLRGLAYVHQKKDPWGRPLQLIHRDISPQNIMVTYDGTAMLVDFGIAKAADRAAMTEAGSLKGKPGYMSPEILHGHDLTQSVDLYAAGVVLHELISMRPMRALRAPLAMLSEVRRGAYPRFGDVGIDLPAAAAEIVYRALAPWPVDRWPDAATFADALVSTGGSLNWAAASNDVANLMRELFPEELCREQDVQTRIERLAVEPDGRALAVAPSDRPPSPPSPTAPPVSTGSVRTRTQVAVVTGSVIAFLTATAMYGAQAVSTDEVPAPQEVPVVLSAVSREVRARPVTKADAPPQEHSPISAVPPDVVEPKPRMGRISVQSKPWGRVILDGKDTGRYTPLVALPVTPGRHHIVLKNEAVGLRDAFDVEVAAGHTVRVTRRPR